MLECKLKCNLFIEQLNELTIYKNKSFFRRLVVSNKPNEELFISNLNEFVTSEFISEISEIINLDSFKFSYQWFNMVKDYIYAENGFKILDEYIKLDFLPEKLMINIVNYKRSMQSHIKHSEKFEEMLNKFK